MESSQVVESSFSWMNGLSNGKLDDLISYLELSLLD